MPPLRTLLVDDETPARQRLRRLLAPYVEAGRVAEPDEAADGVEALERLEATPFGLVFLDVRMPELDGFAVLDRLPPASRPAVVFTTAYDEYAVRAFESNAVDYLLKPVDADRLAEAVERAIARGATQGAGGPYVDRLAALLESFEPPEPSRPDRVPEPMLDRLTVQGRDRLLVVAAPDIVSAEVQDGITNLHVASAGDGPTTRHIVSFTLDALEGRLDPARFMRVHRGALVNLEHLREMIPWFSGRYKLVLTGRHEVIASRARSRELRERFTL